MDIQNLLAEWRIGVGGGLLVLFIGLGELYGPRSYPLVAPAWVYLVIGAVALMLGLLRFRAEVTA